MGRASDNSETLWATERQQMIPGCLEQAMALEGHIKKELGVVLP